MPLKTAAEEFRLNVFNATAPVALKEEFITWLADTGFFSAPASIRFHGNYAGGLFDHSYEVVKQLQKMSTSLSLGWQDARSPWVVGMFHDLCKIDDYLPVAKGGFKKNPNPILSGHAEKSLTLLKKWMKLTEEEILCIRYHMGAYVTEDWHKISLSIKRYPNVLWTHTADMYAANVIGI